MNDNARFTRELPLLPDSELLRLAKEIRSRSTQKERLGDRARRRQETRRIEALNRELEARGIEGPPWWSQMRHKPS